MKRICAFRVDGGLGVGLGHLMRCLAIAQDLKRKKVFSVFILKHFDANSRVLVEKSGFLVETLQLADETKETCRIFAKHGINVVFIDISHRETMACPKRVAQYANGLRSAGRFVILFDGLTDDCLSLKVALPVDIVVIPYFGAQEKKYKRFLGTKFLLGPKYFVFRREVVLQQQKKVLAVSRVRRILVTMGGSDPDGLTLKVVKALGFLRDFEYDVKVVLGKSFSPDLKNRLKQYSLQVALIDGPRSLVSLMAWADVVICGGLTKYEALFLGKIVVGLTKGQSRPFNFQGKETLDDQGIERIIGTIPQGVF